MTSQKGKRELDNVASPWHSHRFSVPKSHPKVFVHNLPSFSKEIEPNSHETHDHVEKDGPNRAQRWETLRQSVSAVWIDQILSNRKV